MQTRISTMALLAVIIACQTHTTPGQVAEPPVQNVAPPPDQLGAPPRFAPAPGYYYNWYTSSTRSSGNRESAPPVVVQFSPATTETVAMLEEDLAVMSRIIEKTLDGDLGEDEVPVKMGIRMSMTGSGRSVRAMYVEGLGPLFMVKINFPLLAPPKVEAKKSEPAASSEWEKARKELRGIPDDEAWAGENRGGNDYDEEKVETLKKALLVALKQAANIRQVKADEFIAVTVFGSDNIGAWGGGIGGGGLSGVPGGGLGGGFGGGGFGGGGLGGDDTSANRRGFGGGAQTGTPNTTFVPSDNLQQAAPKTPLMLPSSHTPALNRGGARSGSMWGVSELPRRDTGRGTVLTIRVKKSNVNSFAKGSVSFDDFAKQALINTYAGTGHDVTSVNNWIGRGSSSGSARSVR